VQTAIHARAAKRLLRGEAFVELPEHRHLRLCPIDAPATFVGQSRIFDIDIQFHRHLACRIAVPVGYRSQCVDKAATT
jgi:hypothetical protein